MEICEKMKDINVVKSDIQFSIELLQRSPRLYSWAKSSKHAPALDVLLGLYNRLDDLCEKFKLQNMNFEASIVDDLTDRLWEKIREESLSRTFFTRKKPVVRQTAYNAVSTIAPAASSLLHGFQA